MTAKVTEVQAFKSIDGEVFDTFLKAHHRNIWVLTRRMFHVQDGDCDSDVRESAARLLYERLIGTCQVARNSTEQAIFDLAKEIE